MIARIDSGSNVKGMVLYNSEKEKKKNKNKGKNKENPMQGKLLSVSNIYKKDTNTIIKTIESYNKLNKNVKKPNIHISLNFHKNDIIDDNQIVEIAEDYMELMGYDEQPFAVFRHFDRDHPHIHITSTRINPLGRKINDSFEKYKSVRITQKLEKKYNLIIAKESSGKEIIPNLQESIEKYKEQGEGSLTNILDNVLETVLDKKPNNIAQYDYYLKDFNVERISTAKGDVYTIESQNKVNRSVPASSLYSNASLNKIEHTFDFNKERKQIHFKNVMGRFYGIYNIIKRKNEQVNLKDFSVLLKRKGINIEVKRRSSGDQKGKINGFIFYDIKTSTKYTATDFKLKLKDFDFILDDKYDLLEKTENIKNTSSDNTTMTDILFNDFSINTTTGEEYQEDLSRKKKKKKKRNNRGFSK